MCTRKGCPHEPYLCDNSKCQCRRNHAQCLNNTVLIGTVLNRIAEHPAFTNTRFCSPEAQQIMKYFEDIDKDMLKLKERFTQYIDKNDMVTVNQIAHLLYEGSSQVTCDGLWEFMQFLETGKGTYSSNVNVLENYLKE